MTLTVLASVSLFALVSTARPIRRAEEELLTLSQPYGYHEAVRTVLQSGAKDDDAVRNCLECNDDVQVRLSTIEEVQDYLSVVDEESVKAVVHLEEQSFHSPDEKELLDVLQRLDMEKGRHTPVSDEQIDKFTATSSWEEFQVQSQNSSSPSAIQELAYTETVYSTPVVVIAASGLASILVLACIGVALYVVELLKRNVFTSHLAWGMLPNLEKSVADAGNELRAERHSLLVDVTGIDSVEVSEKVIDLDREELSPHSLHKVTSTTSIRTEKSDQESDDNFFDVASTASSSPYSTPVLPSSLLPSEDNEKPAETHHTTRKSLPTLVSSEVQEVDHLPGGFPSRPNWSVRASEAKLRRVDLGDGHSSSRTSASRRPYDASPQFDAALAMQLRPGLGVGADAAWLVRFVMAVFGWCAIMVSGGRDY